MPDNDLGQSSSATSEAPTSGVTAGTTADSGQSRKDDGTYGSNYVYAVDDPNVATWKRGKTKEELNVLTDQMYKILVEGGTVANPEVTAAPALPSTLPMPNVPLGGAIPDADAWLSDSAAAADAHFDARIAGVQKDVLAPQLAGIYQANAQTARALAVQSNSDAFSKWGPEIDMQMSAIPVEQRTFQMYSEAVKLIKGAHAAEITQEALDKGVASEIERRMAAGTIRSGEAGTSAEPSQVLDFSSDNLGDRWGHIAESTTLEGQVEFLRKMYPDDTLAEAKQKYLKLLKKGDAVQAAANT